MEDKYLPAPTSASASASQDTAQFSETKEAKKTAVQKLAVLVATAESKLKEEQEKHNKALDALSVAKRATDSLKAQLEEALKRESQSEAASLTAKKELEKIREEKVALERVVASKDYLIRELKQRLDVPPLPTSELKGKENDQGPSEREAQLSARLQQLEAVESQRLKAIKEKTSQFDKAERDLAAVNSKLAKAIQDLKHKDEELSEAKSQVRGLTQQLQALPSTRIESPGAKSLESGVSEDSPLSLGIVFRDEPREGESRKRGHSEAFALSEATTPAKRQKTVESLSSHIRELLELEDKVSTANGAVATVRNLANRGSLPMEFANFTIQLISQAPTLHYRAQFEEVGTNLAQEGLQVLLQSLHSALGARPQPQGDRSVLFDIAIATTPYEASLGFAIHQVLMSHEENGSKIVINSIYNFIEQQVYALVNGDLAGAGEWPELLFISPLKLLALLRTSGADIDRLKLLVVDLVARLAGFGNLILLAVVSLGLPLASEILRSPVTNTPDPIKSVLRTTVHSLLEVQPVAVRDKLQALAMVSPEQTIEATIDTFVRALLTFDETDERVVVALSLAVAQRPHLLAPALSKLTERLAATPTLLDRELSLVSVVAIGKLWILGEYMGIADQLNLAPALSCLTNLLRLTRGLAQTQVVWALLALNAPGPVVSWFAALSPTDRTALPTILCRTLRAIS